jgi:hypothetical protein
MNGVHDLGGTDGLGPVPVPASEPVFRADWALETVLAGNGALSEADLDEATKSVLATPRDRVHHEAHREPVAVDPARG